MRSKRHRAIALALALLSGACGTSKRAVSHSRHSKADAARHAYIKRYKALAMRQMKRYGIPASITLAQGILESHSGLGKLARRAHNHFGIKCHHWRGKHIRQDDDARRECFRKYRNAKESFVDHALFLRHQRRYRRLFRLRRDDYKGWAYGLKRAGYATNRAYPKRLIKLIEQYHLYRFDRKVLRRKKFKR